MPVEIPLITVDAFLYGLGIAASVVCGATGVLEAGRKQVDLFGAIMAGIAASLGGGTVRDLRVAKVVDQDLDLDADGGVTSRIKLELSFKYEEGS